MARPRDSGEGRTVRKGMVKGFEVAPLDKSYPSVSKPKRLGRIPEYMQAKPMKVWAKGASPKKKKMS